MNEPLPIDPLLPQVAAELRAHGALLLMAPPGSGKTTRVPPALLPSLSEGEIVVLEPRRLAARAACSRVAAELGGRPGELVGYQVRGEQQLSARTRIRFVTEGVLVRQIVRDPFLPGVAAVVLDEFHERHLEGDLALAMLVEARATVRPDLLLLVMSATLDPAPLQRFLPGCAVLHADGRLFPVEIVHHERRDDAPLPIQVQQAVDRALRETTGDVLVFLPGTGEIQRCADELHNVGRRHDAMVLPLHGRLSPAEQDLAITPQPRRKIVLSTNVAESSLTIPGVTAVVDSGLARVLRHDRGRGVDVLQLERISMASATQRTGRAGRTAAGRCYRLWTAGEERGMPARDTPEVQRVDLCAPALLVRAFAGRPPQQFGWFEAPEPAALQAADALLAELHALDAQGRVTALGGTLLGLPVHPRLGRVLVAGREAGCTAAAAMAVALLAEAEELGRGDGHDLLELVHRCMQAEVRGSQDLREIGLHGGLWRAVVQARNRLLPRRAQPGDEVNAGDDAALARALLCGFPDRVAVRSGKDGREATMVGGRGIVLPRAADGHDLVLALRLLETGRQARSTATLVIALEQEWLAALGDDVLQTRVDAELDEPNGRVVAVRSLCYRDLALRSSRGGAVPAGLAQPLLEQLLARDPWRWLGEARDLRRVLARAAWLRGRLPELMLPAWDDAAVAAAAASLLPDGGELRALAADDVAGILLGALTPVQRQGLERSAPDRIVLPSGRHAVIDYDAPAGPTVSARLQEFFGLRSVQGLAGGRVPVVLELLAPNHRPLQVTTDLPSFWQNVYPSVRRELSRRYPRHSWPEDPLTAAPEQRPARRPRS